MKRIGIIAAVILVLVIAGILVINGRKIDTDITREHTKVGVILNGVKEMTEAGASRIMREWSSAQPN